MSLLHLHLSFLSKIKNIINILSQISVADPSGLESLLRGAYCFPCMFSLVKPPSETCEGKIIL